MPKLSQIITIINHQLETNVLNTSRFQGGKYYEIAETVKDGEIYYPVIIDNDGECQNVVFDDNYPLQIYHKIMSLNYEVVPADNYGDEVQTIQETAQMSLVLITDRGKLQMTGEDLIALITVNIPGTLLQADLNYLNLYSALMFASGEAIIDNETVYNREYNLKEYLLKPNSIMYSLSYTIVTEFSKKCYSNCS
jgi:hypothetical protein